MTPEQFAYWMQGFSELNEQPPTEVQWKAIREHLATVFTKVTLPLKGYVDAPITFVPPRDVVRGGSLSVAKQGELTC